jgi:hypothetical protein
VVPRGGYEIFGSKSKNGPWVSIKSNWGWVYIHHLLIGILPHVIHNGTRSATE